MPSRSLRAVLFYWLLGPLVALWLFGSVYSIAIIRHSQEIYHNEELYDTASAINVFIRAEEGQLVVTLSDADRRALLFNPVELEAFAVLDSSGTTIAGDDDMPRPATPENIEPIHYYEGIYRGEAMRLMALTTRHPQPGQEGKEVQARILVGETRRQRDAAMHDAIFYIAIPQLVVAAGVAALMWIGVGRGLGPLRQLQSRLSERAATDLQPIAIDAPPEEISAVVDELNRLLERLGKSLQQQTAFIGDAAHQLRTPLAALKASIEYVQRQRSATDPASIDRLADTVDRCIRVVNQLLALAQADVAHNRGIELHDIDVVALSEETVAGCVDAALGRGIDLGLEADAQRVMVRAEPTLLREALRNLIDNAIRYAPSGGRVTVGVGVQGSRVRIAVVDNGPAIAVSDRERIFERFQRGEAAIGTGSGLGLPIARLCARAMGGDAVYFDPPEGGVGFALELPPFAPSGAAGPSSRG